MDNLFVHVHLATAKLTLFLDGNCFLSATAVSGNSFQGIFSCVLADGNSNSLGNASSRPVSSRFDIVFLPMRAKTNSNVT
jgi:hypothetical protein